MMTAAELPPARLVHRSGVDIATFDLGGTGPALILLHGLAGSSRELLPTAAALADRFRVLLIDQRGHGCSTRRPADVSREAFVADVVAVAEELLPSQRFDLVGHSMGAHTALLVAAAHPDLVRRLVLLEGHPGGADDGEARKLGGYLASWPVPFRDERAAEAFLGGTALARAWTQDLRAGPGGLYPRFDADIMERTIAAVHAPRWTEWEQLATPTLAVFAEHGMFTSQQQDEMLRRRPGTEHALLPDAGHDAHLEAHEGWIRVLRAFLRPGPVRTTPPRGTRG